MYKSTLKPLFFLFPPEKAHHITFRLFRVLSRFPGGKALLRAMYMPKNDQPREVLGREYKNPVGLAAGLDKNGEFIEQLALLGFSHVEVGTVTPKPQPGNPKPRLFRLKKDEALINRMGFNNDGVEAMAERLRNTNADIIVGANIGKNKVTAEEDAVGDYLTCIDVLHDLVDYFTINVSSPNTPNLRNLQAKEPLHELLTSVMTKVNGMPNPRPVLLKIAPDLTDTALDDIIEIVIESGISGIVATNTTIERSGLTTSAAEIEAIGAGGLSGKPVRQRSTEVVKYLCDRAQDKFIVVGVGGIHSSQDAAEKISAGAALVQIYSGLIYEGPGLIKRICNELEEKI